MAFKNSLQNIENLLKHKELVFAQNQEINSLIYPGYKEEDNFYGDLKDIRTLRFIAGQYTLLDVKELDYLLSLNDEEINNEVARYQRELTEKQIEKYSLNKSLVYFYKSMRKDGSYAISKEFYTTKIKPFVDWEYLCDVEGLKITVDLLKSKKSHKINLVKCENILKKVIEPVPFPFVAPYRTEKEKAVINIKIQEIIEKNATDINKYLSRCISSTFTLAGVAITQSGTDTNLSGLSVITGVTSKLMGGATLYDLNNLILVVAGTLSYDAITEKLAFGLASGFLSLTTNAGGSITVNGTKVYGTHTEYTKEIGIYIERAGSDFDPAQSWLLNNGSFTLNGAGVECDGVFEFAAAGTFTATNALIRSRAVLANMRMWGTNTNVNGLDLYNVNPTYLLTEPTAFNGVRLFGGRMIFVSLPPTTSTTPRTFEDLGAIGAVGNVGVFGNPAEGQFFELKNYLDQKGFLLGQNNTSNTSFRFTKGIDATIEDSTGSPIEGAVVFSEDVDNGNRDSDYSADENAVGTTNASGIASVDKVVSIAYRNTSTGGGAAGATPTFDFKNTDNNNTGDDTVYFYSYNHQISQTAVNLLGNGNLDLRWTLFDDNNISQIIKATVDAYTTIDNLDQLYDRAKSWKVDSANVEVPSLSDLLFTGNGTELILETGWNILVYDKAGSVFAVDTGTKTITIKASDLDEGTKFKTLKLQGTGTISVTASETISMPYEDANGMIVKISAPANFTIKGTSIAYTQGVTSITTQVAIGTVVEYAIWSLGKKIVYITQTINEPTTIDINYESEAFVNTALDVSTQVANIDASNVGGILTYKFGEMELTLEQAKAVSHRIFEDEIALDLVLTSNATGAVDLLQDSIRINAPVVHLERKDALTISQEVNLRSYIDITNAVAINPAYILTPADTDGLRVIYYKDPIAIDYDQIENKVWNGTDGTLIKAQQKNQLTEISKVSNP